MPKFSAPKLTAPKRSARWLSAGAAALLWAAAAGSAALWWLHMPSGSVPPHAAVSVTSPAPPVQARGAVERALGHIALTAPAADEQKRFVLLGVIASARGQGSALIAVDGQPAKAYVHGQVVTEGWRLDALHEAGVRLARAQGGGALDLPLPQRY